EVTVSVSSHVPKPHTPLQWAAQDSFAEIERKQSILRQTARSDRSLRLKHHHSGISFVEGVLARGDRRLAPVIEAVWRAGARFDGWDECFDLERWSIARAEHGLDPTAYLSTRPVTARLPWDHIDVGLEDGFLLAEYRKAVKGRASPPCGKVAGTLIHHTNLADAEPDRRRLVCYDCGVACDLSKMRDDRLVALRVLGATERPAAREVPSDAAAALVDVSERGGGSPAERGSDRETDRAERVRLAGHHGAGATYSTYRIRFAKVGRAAFLGHLDLVRLIARTLRRADLPLAMTRGFSPKPRLVFGPALGLGIPSLGEMMDIDLEHTVPGVRTWEVEDDDAARIELPADEVRERIAAVCPPGLEIETCAIVRLPGHVLAKHHWDLGLGKLINAVDVLIRPAADGIAHDPARLERLAAAFLAKPTCLVARAKGSSATESKKAARDIDVRALVTEVSVIADEAAAKLCGALDWPTAPALFRIRVRATAEGSAKPSELAKALGVWGSDELRGDHALVARLGVVTDLTPVSQLTQS
ncbi:MAG: TIGR03936 family radical SAM-associated protein, partial [Kofleriaceae bacterium]